MKIIGGFENLISLDLNHTAISDSGLKNLESLNHLEYLNLYNTPVSDKSIASLSKIVSLEKLYLWKSKVTKDGAMLLMKNLGHADINMGGALESIKTDKQKLLVQMSVLFDKKKCCSKSYLKGAVCKHKCCSAALLKKEVCVKCNPGAKGKNIRSNDNMME